jgi:SAM-dependent methyltransferase
MKRNLIKTWVPPNSHVLDCGCGRGGDIHKWKFVPHVKITAIDPDEESMKEAHSRSSESGVGIWFLPPGDIRDAVKWGPYDVVCYNFSLHYICGSEELYYQSLQAIAQAVKVNGRLIGITPDKVRIDQMMLSAGVFRDKLGNTLERVGNRLNVQLADGPYYQDGPKLEPILDAKKFIADMIQLGFRLVVWEPMLKTPNGLVSDMYSKFVFVKYR